jgi:Tfp pilus assembly protein PilE
MTGKRVAVVIALILGAIAVAAHVVFVVNSERNSSHQASCQRYRDALTLAYTDDPTVSISTSGLSHSDATSARQSERSYRQTYRKVTSSQCVPTAAGPCYTPNGLQSDFDRYVEKTIPQIMAAKGDRPASSARSAGRRAGRSTWRRSTATS